MERELIKVMLWKRYIRRNATCERAIHLVRVRLRSIHVVVSMPSSFELRGGGGLIIVETQKTIDCSPHIMTVVLLW